MWKLSAILTTSLKSVLFMIKPFEAKNELEACEFG